jgi:UDP-N-acetyl-D-mannosaminuronic acid dehydrogenase
MHLPGAGVGGHCIPKDPWLLLANAPPSTPVRLIPAARAVNDSMPRHVGELTRAVLTETHRQLASSYLVVLGQAYLANSDDVRNSPTVDLVNWLQAHGASVAVHDPLVPEFQVDLDRVVLGADGLILMVAHDAYRYLDLAQLSGRMRNPVLVDGRHFFDADAAIRAGFTYRCLGIGEPTSAART